MRSYTATDIFSHPARLLQTGTGTSNEVLMRRARERAFDPSIFDTQEPFFFPAEISNNSLDAYFTRMAPSSLRNYAADADRGVSFQDSHRVRELGLGATLTGQYVDGAELVKVVSDIFTLPGMRDSDTFLLKLRAGIARDVSIGFYGGEFRCSICGLDLFDWDCWHFPGVTYDVEVRNDKGEVIETREEVAIAWIEDAHLSEVSIVYDGATPGAGILKASRDVQAGRMNPKVAENIRVAYRGAHIPGLERSWAGYTEGEKVMTGNPTDNKDSAAVVSAPAFVPPAETRTAQDAPQPNPAQSVIPAPQPIVGSPDAVAIRALVEAALRDANIQSSDLAAGLTELLSLSRIGRQYRADLIEEALKEGVRIWGNDFAANTYRAQFEKSDIDFIKQILSDWRAKASSSLPVGRQSEDKPEEVSKPSSRSDNPALQLAPKSAFGS